MENKRFTFGEVTIPVQGMSCGSCVRRIQTALEGQMGIKDVAVDLRAGEVRVIYSSQTTEPAAIAETIRKSGYIPGTVREEDQ